jgi:hypothetical protein
MPPRPSIGVPLTVFGDAKDAKERKARKEGNCIEIG